MVWCGPDEKLAMMAMQILEMFARMAAWRRAAAMAFCVWI
jgi:hypothetical protein|tara:strand:- start:843 stop:962 length:120 start_codon:yes stop_codon:yes gene_type:complete